MASARRRLPRLTFARASAALLSMFLLLRVGLAILGGEPGPPLYFAGMYEREVSGPGEAFYRWTAPHAALDLRRDGRVLELGFRVAHDRMPVTLHLEVGDWSESRHYFEAGPQTLAYYLPAGAKKYVNVSLDTSPALRVRGDTRRLGVALAPIRWRFNRPSEALGAYPVEEDADGRRFRWTAGVSCFPVAGAPSGELAVELRAAHPDIDRAPLRVTLTREGAPSHTVVLDDHEWTVARAPASDAAGSPLCVSVSRTWNPRLEVGSTDGRDLGVAVALPGPGSGL